MAEREALHLDAFRRNDSYRGSSMIEDALSPKGR